MKQLIDMIEAVAYEKSMPQSAVREAMESAIAALARKEQKEPGGYFHADIDEDGNVSVWRVWQIVDNVMDEDRERLGENVGDVEMDEVPVPQWNRQGLQVVKQVLAQRLKQGLRQTIADAWKNRQGDVVMGMVKRVDKNRVIVDLGEPVEGVLAGRDRIPGEIFRVGQRVRALVAEVNSEGQGPVITLSRTHDDFLRELISIEVPEVDLGQVHIRAIARDPGSRAKVAVQAGPGLRHGAAAVCVGMRGVRAQAIGAEINGERVEFLEWNDDPVQMIIAAMSPAVITTLVMDENTKVCTVAVSKENLARAIGTRGQNVRLASKLTGWTINLMSQEDFQAKDEAEKTSAKESLMGLMDMDEEMAEVLMDEGFMNVQDIHHADVAELMSIEGVDEDLAQMIKERAENAVLLQQELEEYEHGLASLDQITEKDIQALEEQQITTLQDLADQATDDVEWEGDTEQLGRWIMEARRKVGMI